MVKSHIAMIRPKVENPTACSYVATESPAEALSARGKIGRMILAAMDEMGIFISAPPDKENI